MYDLVSPCTTFVLLFARCQHFETVADSDIESTVTIYIVSDVTLTRSLLISLRLYTLRYWSNPTFLIYDIRALWRSGLSARMSKIKNGGLDQYGAGPFEQQQFETAGVEEVKARMYSRTENITSSKPCG